MIDILFYALFLLAPALIVLLVQAVPLAARAGPIVLCYGAGLLLGLSGLLPEAATGSRTTVSEASLALALPMLLFSVNVRDWGQVAGRAMVSMFCAILAVVAVASGLFYLFSARGVVHAEQLSGMAVGMYTGGVANLAAIKLALVIPDERFLLFATVDTVVGALYLLFVLTLAQPLFARFLPPFRADGVTGGEVAEQAGAVWDRAAVLPVLGALGAAAVCVGLAVGLAPYVRFAAEQIVVIVLLTSFGLLASFIGVIRRNAYAPLIGMYLIYVFSFCVAASLDLAALAGMDGSILAFVILATFGAFALHALLCRMAGVDRDTFLITSVAAVLSPAFVPMVTRSLGNPAMLVSGMATGILGFAIGNYLGIAVALMLAGG